MKHNLKKFKMLLSGVLVGCGLFHVLKHVVKNTHSWIVKQNQINCQNKNCQISQRSPLSELGNKSYFTF